MTDEITISISRRHGDIFTMEADAIVNPWNRNFVPRLMLIPQGVSGRLKKLTGPDPWKDLAQMGLLPLGAAVATPAGTWPNVRTIIHVAGLNVRWNATRSSVTESARNAIRCAAQHKARSILIPLIGAGTGGLTATEAEAAILTGLSEFSTSSNPTIHVSLVSLPA